MLQITSIKNGFMLDHIKAGIGVKIFRYLHLDKLGHQVALIINADSKKMGKKDIIKIENIEEINYTVLGLLSPGITINEVRNEVIVSKIKPELPERIQDILICENPSCITSQEKYIPHNFTLVDREKGSYKCEYCEQIINPSEV
ncbi:MULTISPECIES: aspartate carbamoyltransferase regulatory subunit [unclassified Clostridium]|uniref:aspartate carbamoyltransferase regulatory subunit n=1 Tax=unclassified Clostridium TaxID=2614128 RepID=UPI00189B615E|nr:MULTISPECIES: aspartate carbamoyltransferase regulatory subunit [unclassified Clostridium]MBO5130955.1 aspartate carbamoyltransferase regulatory subunit [Romboutsia sp.]MBP3914477.1 aspartate carbamoyltransferase regulatory subunit [Clostridium sp.]MEE0933618.1 aspartate carbamoyltransferase regulatory subunit [Clostridium sp.]